MVKIEKISADSHLFTWSEVTQYRELFVILAYRDFKVRYAQTFIGFLWAFLQPVLTIGLLYLVFHQLIQIDIGDKPFLIFIACGLLPWTYFSNVLQSSGSSILMAQAMVRKIYFPRIIIPLSKAVVGLIDFSINSIILLGLMLFYSVPVSSQVVFLPVFIVATIVTSLAVGIWISALSVRFRDFQYTVPFIVQLGLFVTPIAYPSQLALERLPSWAVSVYYFNPMAGIIEGVRWCLLGTPPPSFISLLSFISMAVLLICALVYFRRIDGKIADLV